MSESGSCSGSRLEMVDRAAITSRRRSDRCARDFSPTPSSRISHIRSKSSVAVLTFCATATIFAQAPPVLTTVPTRDQKIVRRWNVADDPRGIALGSDKTVYIGLAKPQAVI